MEQRVCKNKNCRKPLPAGYKHRYCESCRIKHAEQIKNAGKATLGVVTTLGCAAVAIIKKVKIDPKA